MTDTNVHLYDYHESLPNEKFARPLNVVFITSVRDTGACDRNGSMIDIPRGKVYMEGLVENVVHAINEGRGAIGNCIRIAGIITDDSETDLGRGNMEDYPLIATPGSPWIFPSGLRNDRGELLTSNTAHIPSTFRSLPLRQTEERAVAKADFEASVYRAFTQMGGDILISDHLMLRIENLLTDIYPLRNRILNIHPAITRAGHAFHLRGPTPTQDAIDRAGGFKRASNGERIPVTPYYRTGATFHLVNERIDDGPILCDTEPTAVFPTDEPQALRYRNYDAKKIAFYEGIDHYANMIYPQADSIDVTRSVRSRIISLVTVPYLHYQKQPKGIPASV